MLTRHPKFILHGHNGMVKGEIYPLRGTTKCVRGDTHVSLPMDQIFEAFSSMNDPKRGKGKISFFESEYEESDDDSG